MKRILNRSAPTEGIDHLHRYLAVTETDSVMDQNIGNWHVVPGMFKWFDFPDLAAAMAPKYLALNEGGGICYLEKIKGAYEAMGVADRLQITHYPKYTGIEHANRSFNRCKG